MKEKLFYDNILAHKPGLFLSRILYGLFKRVSLDESMKQELRRMNRRGTVVYAIKYRGRLDYLMYHYNFRLNRLPHPKLAFDLDISALLPLRLLLRTLLAKAVYVLRTGEFPDPYRLGFYSEAVRKGTTSLIFLVDPKRFVERFVRSEKDHIQLMLETQKTMERPIFIVPQFVLYQRTPEKQYKSLGGILFGYKDHPGLIRKTVLFFRHNRRAFIDFGEPVNLMEYLSSQPSTRPVEEMAVELKERLVESIDNQRRVILGPIMKSREQLKEIVLRDDGVRAQIEKAASGNPKQVRQFRKKAGEHFDEIAADLNMAYIQFFHLGLTWFWRKIFEGIEVDMDSLARVRERARRGTLIYVPSHKSHIDYLVLNYILHNYKMHIPRVAAGKNLAFWPMGHVFRKSGAFFIRRTFRGARLYQEVFNRYIKALIEEGHPLEFFIEGGRSRSGKVILPKIGFLAILLQAFEEGYCNDLIFVPASITYDRVLEEKAFVRELEGAEKEKESLKQVIRARHFLKRRYGKIYIRFGEPLSLKEYLEGGSARGDGKPHEHLAMHLIQAINRVTLVTPLSLVASTILTAHRGGFHLSELTESAKAYLEFLRLHEAPLSTTLSNPEEAVQGSISLLLSWKIASSLELKEGEFYFVDDDRKIDLEFYKNNIIHHFIHHSFVAVSLLGGSEEIRTRSAIELDYRFLRDLFRKEFVDQPGVADQERASRALGDFLEAGLIRLENGGPGSGYRITRLGYDRLPAWARFAKTFIESYWVAVRTLLEQEGKVGKKAETLKNMNNMGVRFHKLGFIEHPETLSRLNFKNALEQITENVMRDSDGRKDPERLSQDLSELEKRLYSLARQPVS